MKPASLFGEALRNRETIAAAHERIASHDLLARHYRSIGLPAVAAAMQIASRRHTKARAGTRAGAPVGERD